MLPALKPPQVVRLEPEFKQQLEAVERDLTGLSRGLGHWVIHTPSPTPTEDRPAVRRPPCPGADIAGSAGRQKGITPRLYKSTTTSRSTKSRPCSSSHLEKVRRWSVFAKFPIMGFCLLN